MFIEFFMVQITTGVKIISEYVVFLLLKSNFS